MRGLYDNKQDIAPELRILTKFFELPAESDLATKITNRTNNQNGSKPRDFQSNSDIQTRLQSEIHQKYGSQYYYRIRRGERPELKKDKVIENDLIAQILISFDLKKPYETYLNLFASERHAEIFGRPEVTADRVVALHDILKLEDAVRSKMNNRRFANYPITKFFLLYLVRKALEIDAAGKDFITNPSTFLNQKDGRKRLKYCFKELVETLGQILSDEVDSRDEKSYFNYKSELKNFELVQVLGNSLMTNFKLLIRNPKYAKSFDKLWIDSEIEVC